MCIPNINVYLSYILIDLCFLTHMLRYYLNVSVDFILKLIVNFQCHWTKMYPMTLMLVEATFPHVLEPSGDPPVPKPILESQLLQSFWLLPRMPILALEYEGDTALNPSLLQLVCKDACEPISVFQVLRPSEVARYCPSAISEYRELACLSRTTKFI